MQYYHHANLNVNLRSMQEVIDFVLYGNLPLGGGRKKAKMDQTGVVDNQLHTF